MYEILPISPKSSISSFNIWHSLYHSNYEFNLRMFRRTVYEKYLPAYIEVNILGFFEEYENVTL